MANYTIKKKDGSMGAIEALNENHAKKIIEKRYKGAKIVHKGNDGVKGSKKSKEEE